MIARLWRGVTPRAKADDYHQYLQRTGVKDCEATPGNRGVFILRRDSGDESEFLFISLWESLDVIRGFAGEDIGRAVYYPEDASFLLAMEPRLLHYEVLMAPGEDSRRLDQRR
jgi:heme-degrading monooxygenase HmoA